METLGYALVVLLATLGPLRAVPAFAALTASDPPAARRALAIKATILSAAAMVIVAAAAWALRQSWGLSSQAISIAAGTLLLVSALRALSTPSPPTIAVEPTAETEVAERGWRRALSPLTVPVLVTPAAVAAVLLFLSAHEVFGVAGKAIEFRWGVGGVIALMLALNLAGAMMARPLMRSLGGAFQLAVWIFALVQAAIAVQAIVLPLHDTLSDPPMLLPPDAAEASGEEPIMQFAVLRSGPQRVVVDRRGDRGDGFFRRRTDR